MKLSVIVPVYRVETTLDRCVESIIDQNFSDLEVILVDDGSPDHCPQMCDEWACKDHRISVIHQNNGGLSDARNAGISQAKGEFITFVDSDDYLQCDTYRQVMPLTADNDIVEFPVYRFYGSSRQSMLTFDNRVYTDMASYWLQMNGYEHTYAWNKIYRRSLFDDVRYPKGKVFEDVFTLPLLLQKARSIATTDKGLYYYCMNNQGITATAKGPELECLLEAHLMAMQRWCDDCYYLHILNIQMDVFELTGKNPMLPVRSISLRTPRLNIIQRLKAMMLSLLGIKGICRLNKTIHRWIGHRS